MYIILQNRINFLTYISCVISRWGISKEDFKLKDKLGVYITPDLECMPMHRRKREVETCLYKLVNDVWINYIFLETAGSIKYVYWF